MNKNEKTIIQAWIEQEVKNKKTSEYIHVHMDVFDSMLKKNKDEWLSKGIEILLYVNTLLDKLKIPLVLYLGVFFKPKNKPKKIVFKDINKIIKELGNSPPALYLFNKNKDKVFFESVKCYEISLAKINNLFSNILCFYTEYFDGDKYFYALWFSIDQMNYLEKEC